MAIKDKNINRFKSNWELLIYYMIIIGMLSSIIVNCGGEDNFPEYSGQVEGFVKYENGEAATGLEVAVTKDGCYVECFSGPYPFEILGTAAVRADGSYKIKKIKLEFKKGNLLNLGLKQIPEGYQQCPTGDGNSMSGLREGKRIEIGNNQTITMNFTIVDINSPCPEK